jgi:hypothetical protein
MGEHHRKNQPPTGAGKKQSRRPPGHVLEKRSEVVQAHRDRPDLNLEDSDAEYLWRSPEEVPPKRKKAGR